MKNKGDRSIMVEELTAGQLFKAVPTQLKYRQVNQVMELAEMDHIPPVGRKVLVIYDGCRQWTFLKGTEVLVE